MQLNALDLYWSDTAEERTRWERVHELIRRHRPAVLTIQELVARRIDDAGQPRPDAGLAAKRVAELGDAVGMRCQTRSDRPGSAYSVALSDLGHHTALLWQDGITPVPGRWRREGRESGLWHSAACITLDFGGPTMDFISFHWSPFSSVWRAIEAAKLASTMTVRDPCLAAGDTNQIGSDVVVGADGRRRYYDPEPPNPGVARYAAHAEIIGDPLAGTARLQIDRAPAQLIRDAAGMVDVAVHLGAPWQPTVGHWPASHFPGPRRIDQVLASPGAVSTLRSFRVDDSELARSASDHLPVLVGFDPACASRRG
jgi:endonuclease/exonuclease/phosphatase family metal-dependent hydrolase